MAHFLDGIFEEYLGMCTFVRGTGTQGRERLGDEVFLRFVARWTKWRRTARFRGGEINPIEIKILVTVSSFTPRRGLT